MPFEIEGLVRWWRSVQQGPRSKWCRIEGKTPLDPSVWVDASFGKKSALRYILKHNIGDVQILEQVHKMIRPYYKGTKRSI